MSKNLISLGKENTISDIDRKIDYLMCCFFFSKYSQSTLYRARISSLPKIIQLYGNDPVYLRKTTEDVLQSFLGRFFTSAAVEVSATEVDSGIELQISAIVSDAEAITPNSRSVGYSLLTKDSKLRSILNLSSNTSIYPS